jgi:hypothetical protein
METKIVHQCPYKNIIIENKVTDVSSMPSIFSAGCYKLCMNATDKNSKMIINGEAIVDWISSEKNSFG